MGHGYPSPSLSPGREAGNSVLRSVDEILRTEHGPPHHGGHHGAVGEPAVKYVVRKAALAQYQICGGWFPNCGPGRSHRSGRYHDPDGLAESFNPDRYTASVYDRVTDFSPVNSDFSNDFGHLSLGGEVGGPGRGRRLDSHRYRCYTGTHCYTLFYTKLKKKVFIN